METEDKNNNQNNVEQQNEVSTPINWWKIIAILLIAIITMFSLIKIIECNATYGQNNDGTTNLTRRSANNSDISIQTDIDWSSLGTQIIITPKVDIDDLKIAIDIQDNERTTIYSTTKKIGNVKKSVETSCSVTLSELGFTNSFKAKYVSVTVTGGTVSYFT